MILNKVFGNVKNLEDINHYHIETISLGEEKAYNNVKVISDHGHEYEISLENVKDGDVISKEGHNLVVISIASEEVFVIAPKTMPEMGKIAHSLGNRHLPAQFKDGKMLLQCDSRIEEILKSSNITYTKEKIALDKPFRKIDTDHIH